MNTTTAPAGDSTIREDIELLKVARDCAVQECTRIAKFFDGLANASIATGTFVRQWNSRQLIGETLFADGELYQIRDDVNRIFRLLDPVASPEKKRPCNGCFSECNPCEYLCESAHAAAVRSRDLIFFALLDADAFNTERIEYYTSVADAIREEKRDFQSKSTRLYWSSFLGIPKPGNWTLNSDWINAERAAVSLKQIAAELPNGDGTFYRDLKARVLDESKRAIAFAQQCRYATGPIVIAPSNSEHGKSDPRSFNPVVFVADYRSLIERISTINNDPQSPLSHLLTVPETYDESRKLCNRLFQHSGNIVFDTFDMPFDQLKTLRGFSAFIESLWEREFESQAILDWANEGGHKADEIDARLFGMEYVLRYYLAGVELSCGIEPATMRGDTQSKPPAAATPKQTPADEVPENGPIQGTDDFRLDGKIITMPRVKPRKLFLFLWNRPNWKAHISDLCPHIWKDEPSWDAVYSAMKQCNRILDDHRLPYRLGKDDEEDFAMIKRITPEGT